MNGFCLECHFVLKNCWFEVGQSKFKHPVVTLSLILSTNLLERRIHFNWGCLGSVRNIFQTIIAVLLLWFWDRVQLTMKQFLIACAVTGFIE